MRHGGRRPPATAQVDLGRVILALLAGGVWGIKLWHLRGDVGRFRRYWSEARSEFSPVIGRRHP